MPVSRKEVLVSEIISVMFQSRKKAGKLTCQSVFKGQMVIIVYHCNYIDDVFVVDKFKHASIAGHQLTVALN